MNDGKIIIDKIISDAEKVANVTISQAQKEVDALLKAAKDKANRQLDQMDRDAHSEAEAVKAKEISAADMKAKKMLLETKQETLLSTDLSDTEKAAQYLTDAYRDYIWKRE